MHPSCLIPLVLSIFNLPCQLRGAIIFEHVISLYLNFQEILSHIYLSSEKVSSKSDMSHVQAWNDQGLFLYFSNFSDSINFSKTSNIIIFQRPNCGYLTGITVCHLWQANLGFCVIA